MKISNHLQPFNRSEMLVQGIMYADVDNTNFIREYDPPPSKYWLEFLKKKKVSSDFQFSRDDRFLRIHFSRGLEWELYCHDAPVPLRLSTLTFYSETENAGLQLHSPFLLFDECLDFLLCSIFAMNLPMSSAKNASLSLRADLSRGFVILVILKTWPHSDSYQLEEVRVVTEDGAVGTGLQVRVRRRAGHFRRRGLEVHNWG